MPSRLARPAFDASIIIPLFNKLEYTQRCLAALVEQASNATFEVILVDNGSTDGTKAWLASLQGDVRVITNDVNEGFSRANNQGAAAARGEYLVLLNNDTIPLPGWLDALLEVAKKAAEPCLVGAKLIYPDSETIQHAGLTFGAKSKIPYHLYADFPRMHPAVNHQREVVALTGACLLVAKELYDSLGGLAESFRNGGEDVDLCLRAKQAGIPSIYAPLAELYHFESRTENRGAHIELNRRLLVSRWGETIVQDDQRHYEEDGFSIIRYVPKGAFDEIEIETFCAQLRPDAAYLREHAKQVLIVKPSGIGNMVLFTPALQALRETLPEATVTMVSFAADAQVVAGRVDRQIILERADPQTGLPDPDELREVIPIGRYDVALYPPFTHYAQPTPYLREAISHHLVHDDVDYHHRHEVEHNLDLVRQLGYSGPVPPLSVPTGRAQPALHGKMVVGTHLGCASSEQAQAKKWPLEAWKELLASLAEDVVIALFGGLTERDDSEEVAELLRTSGREYHVFAGELTLADSAAAIAQCTAMICHDSGLMHLAAAVETPVLGIFGPTLPTKNAPWGPPSRVRIARKKISCSPCYQTRQVMLSCEHRRCLETLSADDVRRELYSLVPDLINGSSSPQVAANQPENNQSVDDLQTSGPGHKHHELEIRERASVGCMTADTPQVAIHLSTYNRRRYLPRAIDSVLAQTYSEWELWIVNDGGESVSDIVAAYDDPRLHVIDIPHGGKACALNAALAASKSEWIGYLDDDDIYYPEHLAALLAARTQNPGAEIIYSDTVKVYLREYRGGECHETGVRERVNTADVDAEMLLLRNYICHPNFLHTRALLHQVGPYDSALETLIDWDFIRRAFQKSRAIHVPQVTVEYNIYQRGDRPSAQVTGLWQRDPLAYTRYRNRILAKPLTISDQVLAELGAAHADRAIASARLRTRYELEMRLSEDAMAAGDWQRALRCCQQGISLAPLEVDPVLRMGKCLVEAGDLARALPYLLRSLAAVEALVPHHLGSARDELQKAYLYAAFVAVAYLQRYADQEATRRVLNRIESQEWLQLNAEHLALVEHYGQRLA